MLTKSLNMNCINKLIFRSDSLISDNCTPILDKIIINDQNMSFLTEVMKYNYTKVRKERQNAISHFNKQFGLDFSSVAPNAKNISTIPGAVLEPFYISPGIKYRLISHNNCEANGCVRQGGWIVLIVDQGTTLKGQFGGSDGKRVEAGNMLMFGYYNILSQPKTLVESCNKCMIIHFRSSVPSKMEKGDIWSIKVDVWDQILDRKYKQMAGWYEKHHHNLLIENKNCREYNFPDEGVWGNTSGCSSLTKKGDKWHLMIKTVLEFNVGECSRNDNKRVGGNSPPVATSSSVVGPGRPTKKAIMVKLEEYFTNENEGDESDSQYFTEINVMKLYPLNKERSRYALECGITFMEHTKFYNDIGWTTDYDVTSSSDNIILLLSVDKGGSFSLDVDPYSTFFREMTKTGVYSYDEKTFILKGYTECEVLGERIYIFSTISPDDETKHEIVSDLW